MMDSKVKEMCAVRSLQKAGLVCPNEVKPLKKEVLLELDKDNLADVVLYLDANETHYIKQANKLIEELTLKEFLYPIYGFIAGAFITAAVVALGYYFKKNGADTVSTKASDIKANAGYYSAGFQAFNGHQFGVEVDLSFENFCDNQFFVKGSDCKLAGNIFSSPSPFQNFDTELAPRPDECGESRSNNSEYVL